LNADKEIKELLIMQKKGFKWKSILNKDGVRAQVMEIKRPADLQLGTQVEPMTYKAALFYEQNE
jgi:hypothetical protein